ncbi:MAG: hypothetical protein ACRD1V_04855 [Vicinamibacterales bacterium]
MPTKLTRQKPVLFHQVRDGVALPAAEPAGQHAEYPLQRREVDHEPELISWPARRMSADVWTSTPSRELVHCPRR